MRLVLQPKEPSREKRAEIRVLFETIKEAVEKGQDVTEPLDAFNKLSDFRYDVETFRRFRRGVGVDEFIEEVAMGKPPVVPDITKSELIEVVECALDNLQNPSILNWYLGVFEANVPMPNASDLIFYPPNDIPVETIDYEPCAEEVVDRALSYKPMDLI